jgi:DNA-binding GntR family transcriptional regulator
VTPLDRRAARDAFEVVASLHALAAERAVPRLGPDELEEMGSANAEFARALEAGDVDAAIHADDAFHDVFVQASANEEIAKSLERLMPRLRRVERLRFATLTGRRSVAQHERIIERAREGDATRAAEALRDNWLTLGALIDRSFPEEEEQQ